MDRAATSTLETESVGVLMLSEMLRATTVFLATESLTLMLSEMERELVTNLVTESETEIDSAMERKPVKALTTASDGPVTLSAIGL